MDFSRYINDYKNDYSDDLEQKVNKTLELIRNKTISPKLGRFLLNYFIKKEVNEIIKENVECIHRKSGKDKWMMINYSKKLTKYI